MSSEDKQVHYTGPVPISVDLSQTHLRTSHVVAIVLAIISAGIAIARAYMGVTWEVRELANAQREIPTRADLGKLHTELSSELSHSASERVKFYMEHATMQCDANARRGKQTCHLVWPPPGED